MVQGEGIQTKEVIINNDQWLLGYITNYFTISVLKVLNLSVEKKYCIYFWLD
jgi:hypothetical protein